MRLHTYITSTIIACTCLLSSSLSARSINTGTASFSSTHPLAFIENKGQVTDQYHHTRTDIQYKVPAQGLNIFLGKGQIHYQWIKTTSDNNTLPGNSNITSRGQQGETVSFYRLDVTLAGASPDATIVAEEPLADCEHFSMPQTGAKSVTAHVFNKITYRNIYPHIDWVLYTSNNHLKYDFIVHPGGNVADIKLNYDGANTLTVKDGALTASTPMGSITEQAPYCYESETGNSVAAHFNIQGNVVSFLTDSYTGSLTIDPLLSWATYYGGSGGNDRVNDVSCDAAGNVYIAGQTISADNIATSGSHQNAYSGPAGYYDAYIAAFTKGGSRIWGSYFGDTLSDFGNKLSCDAYGHVYLTGSTYSQHNIATANAYQTVLSQGTTAPDAFLAKFDAATGALIWSTYYGGNDEEDGYGVVCDPAGNVYIAGNTYSTNGISTYSSTYHPYHANLLGFYDAFLAKFDSSGNIVWGTYYGGPSFDLCNAIAIDRYGSLYIAGRTSSTDFLATPGSFQDTLSGTQDAYLAKFDTTGHILWSTYFGAGAEANTITCDSAANVFLGGETTSATNISTPGSFQPIFTPGGYNEGFIVKFNTAGHRLWSTYFGGSNTDYLNDMTCDPAGNLYIAGSTASTDNITTPNAYRLTNSGENAFMAKFRNDGTRTYGTYFGGNSGYEVGNAIANDQNGNIYLAGATGSDSAIATSNASQPLFAGPYCGYLAAFSADTNVYITQPYTDTLFCTTGAVFDLHYEVMNHFKLTNIFTVQLSDSTGSFASPVSIGAILDSISGTIGCTFPATAHGKHYRIRIVASNPADTSSDDGLDIVLSTTPSSPDSVSSNSPICTNDTLHLFAIDTTAGITYRWTTPGNTFVYGQSPSLTGLQISDSGRYLVSAMLNGCPSIPDTVMVSLMQSPARPTDSTNSPLCQNDTLFVTAFDTTAGITYSWTGPGGFIDSMQSFIIPAAQVTNSGHYIVTAHLGNCPSMPGNVNVMVHQLVVPSAAIYINPPGPLAPSQVIALTTSITNGGTHPTLQWYKNNVAIPGATTSPYYTNVFVNGDFVKLVVHSSDPCADPDSSITLSGLLGVDNVTASNGMSLYPNPNNGSFTLHGLLNDPSVKQADIQVQNVLGQVIYSASIPAANGRLDKAIMLDNSLPSGIYLLHITIGEKQSVLRFNIQR